MANKLGKQLPFPTTQAQMAEYQQSHTFTGGKWYEGKGAASVVPTAQAAQVAAIEQKAKDIQKQIDDLERRKKTEDIRAQAEEIQRQIDEKKAVITEAAKQGIPKTQDIPASVYEAVGAVAPAEPDIGIPDDLADNPYFKQLDPEAQALISYFQSIIDRGSAEEVQALQDALKLAGEQAEPYWAEQLKIVQNTLTQGIGFMRENLEASEQQLLEGISRIEEDLEYNREHLTLEEQSELRNQKRQYETQLENTQESMAQRGLSSSSIRNRAEVRLQESYTDVVESVGRRYEKEQRAEGVGAARRIEDVEVQMAGLRRQFEQQKTGAVQQAEAVIGTQKLGELPELGTYGLGGITGTMETQKAQDILTRQQALMLSGL